MKMLYAVAIGLCSAICHFEGAQRFCEVHDPLAPGAQIIENHIVHTAPYEQLDDYERGYVDGRCDRSTK